MANSVLLISAILAVCLLNIALFYTFTSQTGSVHDSCSNDLIDIGIDFQKLSILANITLPSIDRGAVYHNYSAALQEALLPQNREITVVVTSCGRLDLLNRTLRSFHRALRPQSYKIKRKIMVEDCCKKASNQCTDILEQYSNDFDIIFTAKSNRFEREYSIMNSLELAHASIRDTPWIYHLEDDWEFHETQSNESSPDVIEQSLKVFESHLHQILHAANDSSRNLTENRYSCVVCSNFHVKQENELLRSPIYNDSAWYVVMPTWTGFSFNAALYPSFVYRHLIKSFSRWKRELDVSGYLHLQGYRQVAMYPPHCDHIGKGRHITK